MRPDNLVGIVFNIPLFSAHSQTYEVKEANESKLFHGHWELKLEWIPTSFSVPYEITILVNKVVDNKMMFTLNEKNNRSHTGTYNLSKKIVKDKECNSIVGLRDVFYKLGQF